MEFAWERPQLQRVLEGQDTIQVCFPTPDRFAITRTSSCSTCRRPVSLVSLCSTRYAPRSRVDTFDHGPLFLRPLQFDAGGRRPPSPIFDLERPGFKPPNSSARVRISLRLPRKNSTAARLRPSPSVRAFPFRRVPRPANRIRRSGLCRGRQT